MARYGANHKGGRPPRNEEQQRMEVLRQAGIRATGSETPYTELWARVWADALQGNAQAQRMVLEFTYGKPRQIIEQQPQIAPVFRFVKAED